MTAFFETKLNTSLLNLLLYFEHKILYLIIKVGGLAYTCTHQSVCFDITLLTACISTQARLSHTQYRYVHISEVSLETFGSFVRNFGSFVRNFHIGFDHEP